MIGLDSQARIWLCTEPTDMRKSFRGLSALVRNQLKHDPLSGQYFVFVNRRKTQMKVLYFDTDGFCIWSKRLEQGQFGVQHGRHAESVALRRTEFEALVEGFARLGNPEHDANFHVRNIDSQLKCGSSNDAMQTAIPQSLLNSLSVLCFISASIG